jgi:hypothetical protein
MMNSRSGTPQFLLLVGGAAVLTALAISTLPRFPEVLQAPSTPFDRSGMPGAAARYRLFQEAAAVIPPGASVAPVSQPRDPTRETELHREAVALLPGRRVIPAALWDAPTHREEEADFLIVAGPMPSPSPGTLRLETPAGNVWQRVRP